MKKSFIKTISILLIAVMFFALTPNSTKAAAADIGIGALNVINGYILYPIMNMESTVLALVGELVNNTMQPQPILEATIVLKGWTITRDFANMFFILILLAIALSFILFPRFQLKQALPRLLLVALLINFSLPVAGVFIDFANVFTRYFLDQAAEGGNLTELIANKLDLTNVYALATIEPSTAVKLDLAQQAFKTLLFGIFFMGLLIFIFFALALMFLLRTGWLYILLILLPMALLLSILPAGKSYFSQWSSKFFQWTFFAPIATFFIFLSIATFSEVLIGSTTKDTMAAVADPAGISILKEVYNYIIITMLLLGSLVAANALGVKTAGTAMSMVKGGSKMIRGGIGRGAIRAGGATARGLRADKWGLGGAAALTKRLPAFIGGAYATRKLTGAQIAIQQQKTKSGVLSDKEKKQAEIMTEAQLMANVKAGGYKSHAWAAVAAKKGMLKERNADGTVDDEATTKLTKNALSHAKEFGDTESLKTIEKSDHRLAIENKEAEIDKMEGTKLMQEYGTTDKALAKEKAQREIYKGMSDEDIEKIWDRLDDTQGEDLVVGKIDSGMSMNQVKNIIDKGVGGFDKVFIDAVNGKIKGATDALKNNSSLRRSFKTNAAINVFGEELPDITEKRDNLANDIKGLRSQGVNTKEDKEALKDLVKEQKEKDNIS
jgi:hypothetical protein